MAEAIAPEELELIRLRLQRQHALGPDRFRAMIEAQLDRRAGPAKIGQPRKQCEQARVLLFRAMIEAQLERRAGPARIGRPPKRREQA